MRERKYEKYIVRIAYANGDLEDINFKGINTSSYNEMLEVYRDVKDKHSNDNNILTIEFLGQSSGGDLGVFFTKKINSVVNDNDLNKDCREIASEIVDRINLLERKCAYHKDIINKCEKKRDTLLHCIENSHNNKFKSIEDEMNFKVDIFNQLEDVSRIRRNAKDQRADLGVIMASLKDVNLSGFTKSRKKFTLTSDEYKRNTEKEVYYIDENNKKESIKKYSKMFNKYIDDPGNQILYFYNNVGFGHSQSKEKLNKKLSKNSNRMVG